MPLGYKPGEKSVYNQTEFLLLKMIIERTSAMQFQEFLRRRIFEPLGMKTAQFGDARDIVPNRISLYTNSVPAADRFHSLLNGNQMVFANEKLWDDPQLLYREHEFGGVGLNMSATDLAKFDVALSGGRLLDQNTLKQMWAPRRLNSGELGDYTAGWQTAYLNGHRIVYHIGASLVEYVHMPDDRVSVILLTNKHGTNTHDEMLGVLRLYVPDIVKKNS